jgi:NADPH-dependent glutamate synthase beta subunit-like oxidoreductase
LNYVELDETLTKFVVLAIGLDDPRTVDIQGRNEPGDLGRLTVMFTGTQELYASLS